MYKKLMQILSDPTHSVKHYFDSRRSNRSGRFFYSREQIQTVIKPRFYPRLCPSLMKIITVISRVCACVRTSAEDANFPREDGGCVYLMIYLV